MHVLVSGSTGLIGSALLPVLAAHGHDVTRLVRPDTRSPEPGLVWDPQKGDIEPGALEGIEAVVHLAGETIAGRWTASKKARIRDSRVMGTQRLCEALVRIPSPPGVLVCASAIGYYGDRGDEPLTEESPPGAGFLPDVCRAWEAATEVAVRAGIRVVNPRIGIVLSRRGGALAKMLPPFQMGAGGIIGDGSQYMSWIAIDDVAGCIHHALVTDALSGPVNAVSPQPATNRVFTKTLGRVLGRPTALSVPAFAVRMLFGEMGQALLLSSARVEPVRLKQTGYPFRFPGLDDALRHVLLEDNGT